MGGNGFRGLFRGQIVIFITSSQTSGHLLGHTTNLFPPGRFFGGSVVQSFDRLVRNAVFYTAFLDVQLVKGCEGCCERSVFHVHLGERILCRIRQMCQRCNEAANRDRPLPW